MNDNEREALRNELRLIHTNMYDLREGIAMANGRSKRAQRQAYVTVAVTLILAAVLIARMAGWL